jgi:hypothetical protein
MLSVIFIIVMLNVIILSVVMLSVVAPKFKYEITHDNKIRLFYWMCKLVRFFVSSRNSA